MIYSCRYCGCQYTQPEGKLRCENGHRRVRSLLAVANRLRPVTAQYEDCPCIEDGDDE